MNDEIIYFILFILIIIIYKKNKNKNKNSNKKKLIINNINNTSIEPIKTNNTVIYGDIPSFRGYFNTYKKINVDEKGGSKPFNNVVINNNNLIANKVNYYNHEYESYRKNPHKQIKVLKK